MKKTIMEMFNEMQAVKAAYDEAKVAVDEQTNAAKNIEDTIESMVGDIDFSEVQATLREATGNDELFVLARSGYGDAVQVAVSTSDRDQHSLYHVRNYAIMWMLIGDWDNVSFGQRSISVSMAHIPAITTALTDAYLIAEETVGAKITDLRASQDKTTKASVNSNIWDREQEYAKALRLYARNALEQGVLFLRRERTPEGVTIHVKRNTGYGAGNSISSTVVTNEGTGDQGTGESGVYATSRARLYKDIEKGHYEFMSPDTGVQTGYAAQEATNAKVKELDEQFDSFVVFSIPRSDETEIGFEVGPGYGRGSMGIELRTNPNSEDIYVRRTLAYVHSYNWSDEDKAKLTVEAAKVAEVFAAEFPHITITNSLAEQSF